MLIRHKKTLTFTKNKYMLNFIKRNKKSNPMPPMTFTTVHPDTTLNLDEWKQHLNVSGKFTYLEDSEWLQKVRKRENLFAKTWKPEDELVY